MNKIFIINTHEPYPFSPGTLNATLVETARDFLTGNGGEVQVTTMQDQYDPATELEKHLWADAVIVQIPVNWMGVPWPFKRYMDQVYSLGMMGKFCYGDGRTNTDPRSQYGTGGLLSAKKYMLSLTFNAPVTAFNDPQQWFFGEKSVDDLFWPMHLNFKFFGMQALETFVCHDVLKKPDVANDLRRWRAHLAKYFCC